MTATKLSLEDLDLTLVSGGALYTRLVKMGIAKPGLTGVKIRIVFVIASTWLAIALLCLVQEYQTGRPLLNAFITNFQESVKFLLVMPLLILAEVQIRPWVTHVIRYFVKSGLIPEDQLGEYFKLVERTQEKRDSLPMELIFVALAFSSSALGLSVAPHMDSLNWRFIDGHATYAELWFRYFAMPAFRFFGLVWFWRLFLWSYLLFKISRFQLRIVPTHPDGRGGLGFLAAGHNNFAILAFAMSCHISGVIGEEIIYHGHTFDQLKGTMMLTVIALTCLSTLPLLVFTPLLIDRKRLGLYQYGILAKHYVDRYQSKWVPDDEQTTASDTSNPDGKSDSDPKAHDNFKAVGSMQFTVFDKYSITAFALASAAPFLPWMLTIYKFDELLDHVVKKLF